MHILNQQIPLRKCFVKFPCVLVEHQCFPFRQHWQSSCYHTALSHSKIVKLQLKQLIYWSILKKLVFYPNILDLFIQAFLNLTQIQFCIRFYLKFWHHIYIIIAFCILHHFAIFFPFFSKQVQTEPVYFSPFAN